MTDKNSSTDSGVADGQDCEVQFLVEQTGISSDHARELVRAYGKDRATLLNAAKMLTSSRVNVRSSRI
jgi:glycerol-3-phosphate dehydrogenase